MTQPIITNTVQKITIDQVGAVTVTNVTTDSNGNFVREIRIAGVIDVDNPTVPVVFTLRLTSPTQTNVTIATPSQTF